MSCFELKETDCRIQKMIGNFGELLVNHCNNRLDQFS